jgi:CXXC-20-CXXC protein
MLRFGGGVFLNIQKCETCGNQFTWKEIQKSNRYKALVCVKCGTKHKVTKMTRILVGLLFLIVASIFYQTNFHYYLSTTIFCVAVYVSFPYFAKYVAVQNHK